MRITLPFPSSAMSGHAKGRGWAKRALITKRHRAWAHTATVDAMAAGAPTFRTIGDIVVHIRFVPANRRGDRTNFPNRMKAYIDGIAEALGVNDSRFIPAYEFSDPDPAKIGFVEVTFP